MELKSQTWGIKFKTTHRGDSDGDATVNEGTGPPGWRRLSTVHSKSRTRY